MLSFIFKNITSRLKIMCLGAHSDDIEIGCGGTLLRLIDDYKDLNFYWVVFGSSQRRMDEAKESAEDILQPVKNKQIFVKGFKDGFFPYNGAEIKLYFEQMKNEYNPDIIFTHYRQDLHQDHRLISELTWNTFRNHLILEYEIPKYDGDFGSPNLFFNLAEPICRKKIQHIITHFDSQSEKYWFKEETFFALLRLRGIESRATEEYAEGFYCRKIII